MISEQQATFAVVLAAITIALVTLAAFVRLAGL